MRIFHFTTGADTAGQGFATRAAFLARRPDWRFDQMRRTPKFGYPAHHEWDKALARELCAKADVIHLTETLRGLRLIYSRRPVAITHHGTLYRQNRDAIDAACRAAEVIQFASTLDLLGLPDVAWLPSVADLGALDRLRRLVYRPERRIRIVHSPTSRLTKGTDQIIAAVTDVARRHPVEFILIENTTWRDCLERKARGDIFVDQLELGYGLNAVEAWGMGMPVVANVVDPVVRQRMLDTFGELPFADGGALVETLETLVTDAVARREWAERGAAHVERFHSQGAVVDRLSGAYERAPMRRAA